MKMMEHERQALGALLHILSVRDAAVERLFIVGPGRVFIKHLRAAGPSASRETAAAAFYFDRNRDELIHILDWLTTAVLERHDWLSNVDDLGRPKKLLKAGCLKVLVHEADKAEARLHQRDPHFLSLTSEDERHVCALGAGYTLVQLLSPDALDQEGSRMRHCIGHGSYDEDLLANTARFFSVRDQDGMPKATLEIVPWDVDGIQYGKIRQFRARRNADPDVHIVDLISGIAETMQWIEPPRTKTAVGQDLR